MNNRNPIDFGHWMSYDESTSKGGFGQGGPPLHPPVSAQRSFWHRRPHRLSGFSMPTKVFKVEYKHHRWTARICLGPNMIGGRRYIGPKVTFCHILTLKMEFSAQNPILAPPPPPLIKVFDVHQSFQCRVHALYVDSKYLVGFRYARGRLLHGRENSLLALACT